MILKFYLNESTHLIFFILLSVFGLEAQDTILLDQSGKITMRGFESFYRVCCFDFTTRLPRDEFKDYYANSDNIYSSGNYSNGKRNGLFTIYNPDSYRKLSIHYNDKAQIDTIFVYDRNGKNNNIKFITDNNSITFYECYDSLGNSLIINGEGMIIYNSNELSVIGNIKNFKPEGKWEIQTPEFILDENYKKSKFISGKATYLNGEIFKTTISNLEYLFVDLEYFNNSEELFISDFYRKRDYPILDSIFTPRWSLHPQSGKGFIIVEEQPSFPGGMEKLSIFIQSKFRYPIEAQQNNIKGIVLISFTIDVDGQVKNPEIINGLGYGCDEAAIEIIKEMPDWIPGQQVGKTVPVKYKLQIRFE